MNPRQMLALKNPLLSLFQLVGNNLYREDKLLPTGVFFSTYVTVQAFEEPFSWHASAGFVRSINDKGNAPGQAIPLSEWDDAMKVLAMNEVAGLLRGIGQDPASHWHKAEIHTMSFQAWRKLTGDEYAQVARYREDIAPPCTLFPEEWKPARFGH